MHVLHVVPNINRDIGGPALSVTRLATSQAQQGAQVDLLTLDYPEHGPPMEVPGVHVHAIRPDPWTRKLRGLSRAFLAKLCALSGRVDVIHNHGLWMQPNRYARIGATRSAIPLVCSPRGMLDEWARQYHAPKKVAAWWAFERANLSRVGLFHATSESEAESIRAAGFRAVPIAVVPNGIDLPDLEEVPDRSVLEQRHPELQGKRWLLFMSRLHPKKGLVNLIESWELVARYFPQWQLLIVGPAEKEARSIIRRLRGAPPEMRVSLMPATYGREKATLLRHSELLVLPTLSENFGNIIGEAMAFGTPVITTHAAPWQVIRDRAFGWWISTGEPPLTECLRRALAYNASELTKMGDRARLWVGSELQWTAVGSRILSAYKGAVAA